MEEGYEQHTSAISSLRSILQNYLFSVGILREILQNSDDAGASKQVRDYPIHQSQSSIPFATPNRYLCLTVVAIQWYR